MVKKILSYIFPINIYKQNSVISKKIEVTWANGELVLDSLNTNYSYGSLQRILRKGLRQIGREKIQQMDSVLVLGVAGGSVIKTLVNEFSFSGKITGVEIDPEIMSVANRYFKLQEIKNLVLVNDDAFEFVLKTKERYNLIIIDIFCDTHMPNFLFEDFFRERTCHLLQPKGMVLFNTMCLSHEQNERNARFIKNIPDDFSVKTIPRVEQHNELIIIEKK